MNRNEIVDIIKNSADKLANVTYVPDGLDNEAMMGLTVLTVELARRVDLFVERVKVVGDTKEETTMSRRYGYVREGIQTLEECGFPNYQDSFDETMYYHLDEAITLGADVYNSIGYGYLSNTVDRFPNDLTHLRTRAYSIPDLFRLVDIFHKVGHAITMDVELECVSGKPILIHDSSVPFGGTLTDLSTLIKKHYLTVRCRFELSERATECLKKGTLLASIRSIKYAMSISDTVESSRYTDFCSEYRKEHTAEYVARVAPNLKELHLGDLWDAAQDRADRFPKSLETLSCYEYKGPINSQTFPPTIINLDLGRVPADVDLSGFTHLEKLRWTDYRPFQVPPIPKSVVYLHLEGSPTFPDFSANENLVKMKIWIYENRNKDIVLEKGMLPPNLVELELYAYHHSIEEGVLPPSLKKLVIGGRNRGHRRYQPGADQVYDDRIPAHVEVVIKE